MKVKVREVQVAPPPKEYVLTLTRAEVDLIRAGLNHTYSPAAADMVSKLRIAVMEE